MIQVLVIKNYALIDDIRVDFQSGMTSITGETGAGKSILLGALSLLLGKRADLSSVKDPEVKCIVEAHFSLDSYNLEPIFTENDLDYDTHTIIRREILPSGKSRAFVNDTPVTLTQLQAIAPFLVDIHSQHETLQIATEDFQMEVIDALADNAELLKKYSENLEHYKKVSRELTALKQKKTEANKELDFNTFLLNELKEANLAHLDQEALEETYETLSNTEEIQEVFVQVVKLMEEEPIGTLETSKEARLTLGKIKNFATTYQGFWDRLNSVIIELEDLLEEIKDTAEHIAADPARLNEVNAKLQNIYKLQQKHSLGTVAELLQLQNELEDKVSTTLELDDRITELENKAKTLSDSVMKVGKELHTKRKKAIPELKKQLEAILNMLGLPNAQFQFELDVESNFKPNGIDSLVLLFSANKGVQPGLLRKVASGGEMSRIMLAIKSVLAKYKNLPTLIFDEIDTGVSGEIANKMADIMVQMSENMQVLTITHLPQIAARGESHLKVYKEDVEHVTSTYLKELKGEERVLEIAEMLGGKKISDAAIANAKELLN